jgi:hypothetical protein
VCYRNAAKVVEKDEFARLTLDVLCDLLKRDDLAVNNETQIFNAVLK